jgi:hypothetical protein
VQPVKLVQEFFLQATFDTASEKEPMKSLIAEKSPAINTRPGLVQNWPTPRVTESLKPAQ